MFPSGIRRSGFEKFLFILVLLQFVASAFFAVTRRLPVADETTHWKDVERYAQGPTLTNLRHQANPASPGAYIWSGLWIRYFGDSIASRRLSILAAWTLVALLLFGAFRFITGPDTFVATCFFLLTPFFPVCAGKWMTEAPGFLAFFLGLFFLLRATSKRTENLTEVLAAGFFFGVSIWFKQFFLAAAPAAVLTFLVGTRRWIPSLLLALFPGLALLALLWVWGALTPLAMRSVANPETAKVALNPARALNAAIFCGIYSLPFFPWRSRSLWLRPCSLLFLPSTLFVLLCDGGWHHAFGAGPIETATVFLSRHSPFLANLLSTALAATGFTILLVIARMAWKERQTLFSDSLALFGALFGAFFILENLGAGGNIPFYERYIFNVTFFIVYFMKSRDRQPLIPLLSGVALFWLVVGNLMLWRDLIL